MTFAQAMKTAKARIATAERGELENFAREAVRCLDGCEWSCDNVQALADALSALLGRDIAQPHEYDDEQD